MAIKLISIDSMESYLNVLCYGDSGVGKTTLCRTATDPIIISAEGGLVSIKGYGLQGFEIKNRSDCNEIYDWLKGSKEAKSKYQWICLDSLSEIAEVLLSDEKSLTKDNRQAYGVMNDEMAILIRGFRDLPYNTYFTAKNKKIIDEESGAITYMPSVPGKALLNDLPYFFDEVFLLQMGKTKEKKKYRYLQTIGDRQYVAKDRSGALASKEKPDLTHVFNKITKHVKEKTNVNTKVKDNAITPAKS